MLKLTKQSASGVRSDLWPFIGSIIICARTPLEKVTNSFILIDSGASANSVSIQVCKKLNITSLKPTKKKIYWYESKEPLELIGEFDAEVSHAEQNRLGYILCHHCNTHEFDSLPDHRSITSKNRNQRTSTLSALKDLEN